MALTRGRWERSAAAATALQSLTGLVSESAYAPQFLLGYGDVLVDPPLPELAAGAFSAVLADGSGWRLVWANDIEEDEALGVVEELRADLALPAL